MARSNLPTQAPTSFGENIESYELPDGTHVPYTVVRGSDGTGVPADIRVDAASGALHVVLREGTYGYASGASAATVNVPSGARLRTIKVLVGPDGATMTVGGGSAIVLPTNGAFDHSLPGSAVGAAVVLSGDVESYYVDWVV